MMQNPVNLRNLPTLEGRTLTTWSYKSGKLDSLFTVLKVDSNHTLIELPDGTMRKIGMQDIQQIAEFWPDYSTGRLPRRPLGSSWNSTYIITMFHELEIQ